MSRAPFDQFGKQLIEELLSPFGQIQLNREVLGEPRFIDLWFSPSRAPTLGISQLGLLGRLTTRPCLIELFRNPPSPVERESGYLKLYSVRAEMRREAKRNEEPLSEDELAVLWILTPTASEQILQGLGG